VGRFESEDRTGDGVNWFIYGANNPVTNVDVDGNRSPTDSDGLTTLGLLGLVSTLFVMMMIPDAPYVWNFAILASIVFVVAGVEGLSFSSLGHMSTEMAGIIGTAAAAIFMGVKADAVLVQSLGAFNRAAAAAAIGAVAYAVLAEAWCDYEEP